MAAITLDNPVTIRRDKAIHSASDKEDFVLQATAMMRFVMRLRPEDKILHLVQRGKV
jgi:hypothetical protein